MRKLKALSIAGLLTLAGAGLTNAAPISHTLEINVGDIVYLADDAGSPGGLFQIYDVPKAQRDMESDYWSTFCVQRNEFVQLETPLLVNSMTKAIEAGPPQSFTDLAAKAAYVYDTWVMDRLVDVFEYVSTNSGHNNAIQDAIWFFQGQIAFSDVRSDLGRSIISYTNAQSEEDWADALQHTLVLNLRSQDGSGFKQDQLYSDRFQDVNMPEPASLTLVLLGAGALVARRRRCRRHTNG